LEPGDICIDGGNSYYVDDIRRASELAPKRSTTSTWEPAVGCGAVERGYCMMIGGEDDVVGRLDPIFAASLRARATFPAPRDARSSAEPPRAATCTADRTAPATS
jgi:6-phosphogluconate dehydrogenase